MNDSNLENRISQLDDVELVRMLTLNAKEYSPEAISIATAEAGRRGVPIDAAFIPSVDDEAESVSVSHCFEAGGAPILCPHCSNDQFSGREILLNTRGLTFLKLDWLNRSATALACAKCGHIQLFAVPPTARDGGA
jgi:predicted nucleic-acid-binding Zn-ribbon protein